MVYRTSSADLTLPWTYGIFTVVGNGGCAVRYLMRINVLYFTGRVIPLAGMNKTILPRDLEFFGK